MLRILFLLLLLPVAANAQKPSVFATDSLAIRGYDPVAYFIDAAAVRGTADYTVRWGGAVWQFSSAAHRDSFSVAPHRYAPQYGGYCAYGCSQGYKAPTDPEAWKITGGKLYLNYNKAVQKSWLKDADNRIMSADSVWMRIEKL